MLELLGGELVSGQPWVKLDAGFWAHPKVLAAGNVAAGVYARALAYCGANLSDGFVPLDAARIIGKPGERRRVTEGRLWLEVVAGEVVELLDGSTFVSPGEGYFIPDYTQHNQTRAASEAARARMSDAGRMGAERRWGKGAGKGGEEGGEGA